MNKKALFALGILPVLALALLFTPGCFCSCLPKIGPFGSLNNNSDADLNEVAEKALEVKDLDGNVIDLSKYAEQGKVVILAFGATWCSPCKTEAPELQSYYESANHRQVELLWVFTNETNSAAKNFRDDYNLTFPLVNDKKGILNSEYRINAFPTTVFIKPNGKVSTTKVGGVTKDDLTEKVAEAME